MLTSKQKQELSKLKVRSFDLTVDIQEAKGKLQESPLFQKVAKIEQELIQTNKKIFELKQKEK